MKELEELEYELAWRSYDNILTGIYNLESKATSILVANSLLIVILTTIFREESIALITLAFLIPFASVFCSAWSIMSGGTSAAVASPTLNLLEYQREPDEVKTDMKKLAVIVFNLVNDVKKIANYKNTWFQRSVFLFWVGIGMIIFLLAYSFFNP